MEGVHRWAHATSVEEKDSIGGGSSSKHEWNKLFQSTEWTSGVARLRLGHHVGNCTLIESISLKKEPSEWYYLLFFLLKKIRDCDIEDAKIFLIYEAKN